MYHSLILTPKTLKIMGTSLAQKKFKVLVKEYIDMFFINDNDNDFLLKVYSKIVYEHSKEKKFVYLTQIGYSYYDAMIITSAKLEALRLLIDNIS